MGTESPYWNSKTETLDREGMGIEASVACPRRPARYRAGSRRPPAGRDRVRAEFERTLDEVALVSSTGFPD